MRKKDLIVDDSWSKGFPEEKLKSSTIQATNRSFMGNFVGTCAHVGMCGLKYPQAGLQLHMHYG